MPEPNLELLDEPADEHAPVSSPALDTPGRDVAPDDVSTREKLAQELAAEEVTAVLTGVLDRLGAAHHRPFSRA
jgi:hypothetical protein